MVAPGKASVVKYFHSVSSLFQDRAARGYLFQYGSGWFRLQQWLLPRNRVWERFQVTELLLSCGLSLWTPPSRNLQVCAERAEQLAKEARGSGAQRQALCVGWNASHSNQRPRKTTWTDQGIRRGVQGPWEHATQLHLTQPAFLMAPVSSCLDCFQASSQVGLETEKFCS